MTELLSSLKTEWQLAEHSSMARVPLYHQLYSVLKSAILDGTIPYDAQMPTEQQLAATFAVSRITAKRAMDELAAENLIARFRGKGSHVTYHYTPKPVRAPLVGMLENLIEMRKHSIVRVVSIKAVVPPADVRQILGLADKDIVHKVVRVNSNEDGEPYAYYLSWTAGIKKSYTKRKLENNTRLDLLRENDINLAKVEQFFGAENASRPVAEKLDVEPGAALLSIRRLGYDESGKIVDVLDGLYNPKRFQYALVSSVD
ncbi:UTRA domain-containing protein [Gammaproteobacteria bacterium]|nr:UTRA domain-containing protein [Gammaproteobacteria bacterium]